MILHCQQRSRLNRRADHKAQPLLKLGVGRTQPHTIQNQRRQSRRQRRGDLAPAPLLEIIGESALLVWIFGCSSQPSRSLILSPWVVGCVL